MATYVFPSNQSVYVPTLSQDFQVEFLRNEWPINRYINRKATPKQDGYYNQFKNDNQARVLAPSQFVWPDGNDPPTYVGTGTDSFVFNPYKCIRYCYPAQLGTLAVEQAEWDILAQTTRFRAAQGMTCRSLRIADQITNSSNYPTANYSATASGLGYGAWGSATSTNPYILETVLYMQNTIVQATLGSVTSKDLRIVMNPNTARLIRATNEFIDFLKQSPDSLMIWEGTNYNARFGLPPNIYGVELVVDDTVVVTSDVGASTTTSTYTIPDDTVVMLSKQNAITPETSGAFSTFEQFVYSDWAVKVFKDERKQVLDIQVIENTAEVVVAGQSGFLLANCNG